MFVAANSIKYMYDNTLNFITMFLRTSLNPQFTTAVWVEMSKKKATYDIWNYYVLYEGVDLPKNTLIDISGIENTDYCIAMIDTDKSISDIALIETSRGPVICMNRAAMIRDDESMSMFMILYQMFKILCGEYHRYRQNESIKIDMRKHGIGTNESKDYYYKYHNFNCSLSKITEMINYIDPCAIVLAFATLDNLDITGINISGILDSYDCFGWLTKFDRRYDIFKQLREVVTIHDLSINAIIYSQAPYMIIKANLLEDYEKDYDRYSKMVDHIYNEFKSYLTYGG